jgi:hypothetical protein
VDDSPATLYVYYGVASGLPAAPSVTTTLATLGSYPNLVSGGGDVDGDGYSDVILTTTGSPPSLILFGGPSGITTSGGAVSSRTATVSSGSYIGGGAPRAIGDVNGDGIADFGVPGVNSGAGPAGTALFFGGAGPFVTPAIVLPVASFVF